MNLWGGIRRNAVIQPNGQKVDFGSIVSVPRFSEMFRY